MTNKTSVIKKNRKELKEDFNRIETYQNGIDTYKEFYYILRTKLIDLTDRFRNDPSSKVLDISTDTLNIIKQSRTWDV